MKQQKRYSVGIYCRLSKDDMSSGESSSIISQKNMLEKYVKDNSWTVFDCYIDDGYSGTNFNRPDFERMVEDIEADKINMVIVKDLSRLGRNYLMTGQYTDIYFPDRNVRFIALNDGIDTLNKDNDIAPFKNILNAGNVCRSKCCKIFKTYLYQTPIDFLNRYRLERGVEHIATSSVSITEIALACGFSSPSYFTEIFRQYKGYTPTEYRAKCRQGMTEVS